MDDDVTIRFGADTSAFERSLRQMQLDADRFGTTLTGALRQAVVEGTSLEDVLRGIGRQLAGQALTAGLKPLEGLISGFASNLLGGLTPFAMGGAAGPGSALGSGLGSGLGTGTAGIAGMAGMATVFSAGGGLAAAGQAGSGPALPAHRAAGGAGAAPVTVNVSISTPDAASFRRNEAQIAAMMARAVARGNRNL